MRRRNAFKALGAMVLAPLGFLKGADAGKVLAAVDVPEPGDRDILDTIGPYDRLGDAVTAKMEVWVVENPGAPPPVDKPGVFTAGHPYCTYCHGTGTVLDGVGKGGWAVHKLCPACQYTLASVGGKCWYVVTDEAPADYRNARLHVRFDRHERVLTNRLLDPAPAQSPFVSL